MKIQIVYPNDGWCLKRLGQYLADGIPGAVGSLDKPDTDRKWDVTYYLNYWLYHTNRGLSGLYQATKNSRISGGLFTHREGSTFDRRAKQLDFCISLCRRYAESLTPINPNSYCVYLGIDMDRFKPVLRLGFIGRTKESGRKGEELFDSVRKIPYVQLRETGGTLSDDEIPEFYHSIDCVLITSKVEGGPLCFLEGLASGKEIITTDVGMAGEFGGCEGVHVFDPSDPDSLLGTIEKLYQRKLKLRAVVEKYSVGYFVSEHQRVFEEVYDRMVRKQIRSRGSTLT